jgi:hypothetical protein
MSLLTRQLPPAIRWITTAALALAVACRPSATPGGSVAVGTAISPEIQPFVGAWRLLRQEGRNVRTGEPIASATADSWPGLLVYTSTGWMSVAIDRRPTGGTYWGYFGRYSVSRDTVVHDITGGVPSVRGPSPALYSFEEGGRRLVITTRPGADGTVVSFHFQRSH